MPGVGDHFGRYRIESRLGYGGMGVVFAAVDTVLGRRVALKVVNEHLADQRAFVTRFQREAVVMARLDSPHVITILDSGMIDGSPFIATQLVAGGDLGHLLSARGPLHPSSAVWVCAQVVEALEAVHRVGIVHRDIKPTNVLVRDPDAADLHAFLCDFGVAHDESATKMTADGSVIGTWAFLAPEVADGAPATVASDIYAVGCLLWTTLTGKPPYVGSDAAILRQHQDAPIPQLDHDDELAARLNAVLRTAMAKDPSARPPSAEVLRRMLTGDTPVPQDTRVRARVSRTRGRGVLRTRLGTGLASLLVLGAAAGAGAWQLWSPEGDPGTTGGSRASGNVGEATVEGSFGRSPTVSYDPAFFRTSTTRNRLVDGDGPTVAEGDVVFLHLYIGTPLGGERTNTWTAKDDSGVAGPAEFMIVDDSMLAPVHEAIVGERVGSRVVVETSSAEAFGTRGRADLGVAGEDSVVIVFDIMSSALDAPTGRERAPGSGVPRVLMRGDRPIGLDFTGVPAPADHLDVHRLVEGTGPALEGSDSQIAVRYLSQVRGAAKPDDSNYDLAAPGMAYDVGSGVEQIRPLDLRQTIRAWQRGLDGVTVGSRVILSAPAVEVYGRDGLPNDIQEADSIYFLIDVLGVG